MKILYFHQYFTTPDGSGGTRSYEMAKLLVSQGHEVTMVYAKDARAKSSLEGPYKKGIRRGAFDQINLIEFDLSYSNRLSLIRRALIFILFSVKSIKLVFTEKFDLVFATSTPLTAGIPGIFMKIFKPSKKFIFEVRDLWPELPKAMGVVKNPIILKLMDWLEYLSYNFADGCVALSPGIKEGIEKRLSKPKPVVLIPNGCDLEKFYPGNESKSIFPGLQETDFVAIFTGAHGIANGLHSVLDAAKILQQKGDADNIKLIFIGDGNQKDLLKTRAQEEQLFNCIFLDPVPKKELLKYLHASNVGLMILDNIPAFYFGTSPNKFFDYIATGLPVFNNYPGWLAGLIDEHNCGISVKPSDPELFAEALIFLASNPEKLNRMSKNARSLAENMFDRHDLGMSLNNFMKKIQYGE